MYPCNLTTDGGGYVRDATAAIRLLMQFGVFERQRRSFVCNTRSHKSIFGRTLATISLLASGVLAAMGADDGLTLSPVKGTITDEPVIEGHCGRWIEHGLSATFVPTAAGQDPRIAYNGAVDNLDGLQGCSGLPCNLPGNTRKAAGPLEAVNTLWFFSTTYADTPPLPSLPPGAGADTAEAERAMVVQGQWSRKYTYTPGSGLLASRGVRAKLLVDALLEFELALNRRGPTCASGACSSGSGLAEATLRLDGLLPLAPELQVFFTARAAEENQQEWYHLPGDPETLRRRVSLSHTWCRETALESWNFGIQFWPLSVECGGSGPDAQGELVKPKVERRFKKEVDMCIRAPAVDPDSPQPASFTIMIDGFVDANTEITGSAFSRTTSKVAVTNLRVKFQEGCVECDPGDGEGGLEQQGGQTGAG